MYPLITLSKGRLCEFFISFETEGRHARAKAYEVVKHLASQLSSREEISQPEIELPTSSDLVQPLAHGLFGLAANQIANSFG